MSLDRRKARERAPSWSWSRSCLPLLADLHARSRSTPRTSGTSAATCRTAPTRRRSRPATQYGGHVLRHARRRLSSTPSDTRRSSTRRRRPARPTPHANLPYPYSVGSAVPEPADALAGNAGELLPRPQRLDELRTTADGTSTKGNFCSATYDSPADPATDVWVTQEQVPLFLPLLRLHAEHQRARARPAPGIRQRQTASADRRPDPAQTPCVTREGDQRPHGALITDVKLTKLAEPEPGRASATPNWTVTLPAMNVPAAQLSVQAYIPDDCANPGYPSNGALLRRLDTASSSSTRTHRLPAGNPAAPAIGSVFLTPAALHDAAESARPGRVLLLLPEVDELHR